MIDDLNDPVTALKGKAWRSDAAKALGMIGGARTVEPLIAALTDREWRVRASAAEALGKVGVARAVEPLLATALMDKHESVQKSAARALDELGWKP